MKTIYLIFCIASFACVIAHAALPNPDSSRGAPLEFLADIPSLKGVALGMSEDAFLKLVAAQKLSFEKEIRADETSYFVHVQKGTAVYFGFREGRCSGIQRMRE